MMLDDHFINFLSFLMFFVWLCQTTEQKRGPIFFCSAFEPLLAPSFFDQGMSISALCCRGC